MLSPQNQHRWIPMADLGFYSSFTSVVGMQYFAQMCFGRHMKTSESD